MHDFKIAGAAIIAAAGLLAALPAKAAPFTAFATLCEEKVPVASCSCMVNELQRNRTGQIVLEVVQTRSLPENQKDKAGIAIANRYGLKGSEMKSILENSKSVIDAAVESCK